MAWYKEAASPWSFKESSRSNILKPSSTFLRSLLLLSVTTHNWTPLRTRHHFDACSLFWLAPGDTAQGKPPGKYTVWRAVFCQVSPVLCCPNCLVLLWHNFGSQCVSLTLPSPFYPQKLFLSSNLLILRCIIFKLNIKFMLH